MPPEKYHVWLQQKGKDQSQCIREYCLLVATVDVQFNETLKAVASGLIKEINIDSVKAAMGAPLLKPVPQPAKPDNTEYISSLKDSDLDIFNLYQQIEHSKD